MTMQFLKAVLSAIKAVQNLQYLHAVSLINLFWGPAKWLYWPSLRARMTISEVRGNEKQLEALPQAEQKSGKPSKPWQ